MYCSLSRVIWDLDQFDYINRMVTLSVITFSNFHFTIKLPLAFVFITQLCKFVPCKNSVVFYFSFNWIFYFAVSYESVRL
jgi:hypothetical protein